MKKQLIISHEGGANKYPPMGALYAADYFIKQGSDVTLIKNSEHMHKILDEAKKADRINMSVITSPEIQRFANIAKEIKKEYPEKKITWGGIHPTINTEQVQSEKYVDNVFSGKLEDMVELSPRWDLVEPISQFVYPAEHSVKTDGSQKNMFYYLMTSENCPFDCSFCHIGNSDKAKTWKGKSFEWVEDQIDEIDVRLKKHGIRLDGIGIWDDYFWGNKKRADKILEHFANNGLGYLIEARASSLVKNNGELMKKLKDTGCMQVFVGAESFNQDTLDYINKHATIEDYARTMEMAKDLKLPTRLSLIVGFPNESDKSVNDTLDGARDIPKENPYISISGPKLFTPYPGTLEYNRALEKGLQVPATTEEWSMIHRHTDDYLNRFPWIKENLSPKTLNRLEAELRK